MAPHISVYIATSLNGYLGRRRDRHDFGLQPN